MYTYTYGGESGQKNHLSESSDKVVIRTRNARKLEDAVFSEEGKQVLLDFDVEMEVAEADVTVLKAKDPLADGTLLRDRARQILKTEPELRFAGRVLTDPQGKSPVLYTENIFIKFFDHITPDQCEKILAENDLVIKQKLDFAKNSYFAGLPENTGLKVFEVAEKLLVMPEVEFCHPELIRRKGRKTIHPKQWHLKKTTINGVVVDAHANVEAAHQITQGENVRIAIIDTGFDIDHPEFKIPGKVVDSWDATKRTADPRPKGKDEEDENHGTSCAGVATASGIKVSGVAPKALLIPIRQMSDLGSIAEANAFKWAKEHGADVISCSWGAEDGDWEDASDPIHEEIVSLPDSTRLAMDDAIKNGRKGKGCVITWAAGNGNENVMNDGYASYEKVITVAACNDTGKRSVYSDYGPAVWCSFPSDDSGSTKLKQPSPITTGIYTTDRRGTKGYDDTAYCDNFGGTSSACPGVAGIVALILSANPDLTSQQVKTILKETSDKIDTANGQYDAGGHSNFYGYGRVNAEKAVKKALEMKSAPTGKAVKIVSALVDPVGADAGKETVTLRNNSPAAIDLAGWTIEVKGKSMPLSGIVAVGENKTFILDGTIIKLANTGGAINLLNAQKIIVDSAVYAKNQVKAGVLVAF